MDISYWKKLYMFKDMQENINMIILTDHVWYWFILIHRVPPMKIVVNAGQLERID